jgi:hypothetical protein
LALSGQSRHRNILSAIGVTTDKSGHWPAIVCPLMTQSGHSGGFGPTPVCQIEFYSMKA